MSKFVFDSGTLISNYIEENDWRRRENSNSNFSMQGLNCYVSSEIIKDYWLNHVYDTEIRDLYINGAFHIHDLGQYSAYCAGWDLVDLLTEGFGGNSIKVESKPPRHLSTALSHLCNFMFTLAGEIAGAVAVSNFDTLLAPFIYYDALDEQEVYQELQSFIFNCNVPTRTGFQAPFSNVTVDINVPASFKDRPVIIGGELQEKTYSEFQEEMNMFNRCFFRVLTSGDRLGRVFPFPIPTINVTKDFDWDNPNIDDMWEATAKYGIPYFANLVNSNISPDDIMSMCCRLSLDISKLQHRGGGLFGSAGQTGSVGVCTLNLPQAAFYANGSEEDFLNRISYLMEIAKKSLVLKREKVEELTEIGLYPYAKHFLRHIKERGGKYWSNHFSTIGVVGGNEACLNLIGKPISSPEGVELIKRMMEFMNDKLLQFQEETGTFWNLEATPAEGTAFSLARKDQKNLGFGDNIHYSGTKEVPFYCNSTQVPVGCTDDIFELLDMQDEIQSMYTGGTVQHVFIGESQVHPQAVKNFIKTVCENYKLPYLSITPTFSICKNHGYLAGEKENCPTCGENCEVYSRVVGYIRPVSSWNDGKQQEFKERKYFLKAKQD